MVTIDLLRHGALEGGVKYRGSVDDPLTLSGRQAMEDVWAELAKDVTVIISSPLSRCAQPASDWAKASGAKLEIDDRVHELHYGLWEGKTAEEIEALYPGMLAKWRENPQGRIPPEGEAMDDFSERIALFLADIIARHQGEHVLVVGHSGSIRVLLAHALAAPVITTRHLDMPYACWSRLVHHQGQLVLKFHARETRN